MGTAKVLTIPFRDVYSISVNRQNRQFLICHRRLCRGSCLLWLVGYYELVGIVEIEQNSSGPDTIITRRRVFWQIDMHDAHRGNVPMQNTCVSVVLYSYPFSGTWSTHAVVTARGCRTSKGIHSRYQQLFRVLGKMVLSGYEGYGASHGQISWARWWCG